MTSQSRSSRKERGSALISALAIVAIMSFLMSGVCLLSTSYADRQRREGDYALAMQLAEAGTNYEINYYSVNNTVHLSSSPYSGSVPGQIGTFSVYSDAATPNYITSTGTVGGISRVVRVNVGGSSIFDGAFATFGTTSVTLNQNTVTGNVGSNANVAGSLSGTGGKVTSHCNDNYDTVDNLCQKKFGGNSGWDCLRDDTHRGNQCGRTRCLISSWYPYWNATTTCNWPTTFSNGSYQCKDAQVQSLCPSGIIIFEPGDYYFSTINLQTSTVYCDSACNACPGNTAGPCRFWCGQNANNSDDNEDDCIKTNYNCTSSQASCQPRCFYGKSHTCTLTHSSCSGGFYGVKCGKSGTCTHSKVILDSCRNFTGSVIGDDVVVNSNTANVSSANLAHSADPAKLSGFGFAGSWTEMAAPGAGKVFADGSNN